MFEWTDTDGHIQQAKKLGSETSVDAVLFALTRVPLPSKRFLPESRDWKELIRYMCLCLGSRVCMAGQL